MRKFQQTPRLTQEQKGKTPIEAAFCYIGLRQRTINEVNRYLTKEGYTSEQAEQAICRLKELKYLDDIAYAEDFVRTRLNTKPFSRAKLLEQLFYHGITQDIAESTLGNISDETEFATALLIAQKYSPKLQKRKPEMRGQYLLRYLLSKGYTYDIAKLVLEHMNEAKS